MTKQGEEYLWECCSLAQVSPGVESLTKLKNPGPEGVCSNLPKIPYSIWFVDTSERAVPQGVFQFSKDSWVHRAMYPTVEIGSEWVFLFNKAF